MFKLNRRGCNRWVILAGGFALKFPRPTSWHAFLYGLLNNINEAAWSHRPGCCPVIFAVPGGWLNVMPRVRTLTEEEFERFDARTFSEAHDVPVEHKADSFGYLNGQIVAVDFGWAG